MRKIISTALLLISFNAFSMTINLGPGESIYGNQVRGGDLITCGINGGSSLPLDLPRCRVKNKDHLHRHLPKYSVYIGKDYQDSYFTLDKAYKAVKAAKEVGLCR